MSEDIRLADSLLSREDDDTEVLRKPTKISQKVSAFDSENVSF